jgi:hypothetical protein
VKLKLTLALLIVFVIFSIGVTFRFYSYIFARSVTGEVVGIERLTQPGGIITGGALTNNQVTAALFSFAVAVKDKDGEIVTASSDDRRWAVVEKGGCVEARFFPYPFWEIDKAGTYFRVRLVRQFNCPAK